jgi:hypothetical protein
MNKLNVSQNSKDEFKFLLSLIPASYIHITPGGVYSVATTYISGNNLISNLHSSDSTESCKVAAADINNTEIFSHPFDSNDNKLFSQFAPINPSTVLMESAIPKNIVTTMNTMMQSISSILNAWTTNKEFLSRAERSYKNYVALNLSDATSGLKINYTDGRIDVLLDTKLPISKNRDIYLSAKQFQILQACVNRVYNWHQSAMIRLSISKLHEGSIYDLVEIEISNTTDFKYGYYLAFMVDNTIKYPTYETLFGYESHIYLATAVHNSQPILYNLSKDLKDKLSISSKSFWELFKINQEISNFFSFSSVYLRAICLLLYHVSSIVTIPNKNLNPAYFATESRNLQIVLMPQVAKIGSDEDKVDNQPYLNKYI